MTNDLQKKSKTTIVQFTSRGFKRACYISLFTFGSNCFLNGRSIDPIHTSILINPISAAIDWRNYQERLKKTKQGPKPNSIGRIVSNNPRRKHSANAVIKKPFNDEMVYEK